MSENQIESNSPLSEHIKPHPVASSAQNGEKIINGAKNVENDKKQQRHGSENLSDNSDQELEPAGIFKQRTFFRRFSFKGITKGKALNFFHRAGSDEVELGPGILNRERKGRSTKTVVECKREGLVSLMAGDGLDTPGIWEKCRMTLVKAAGGFMLEFFSPPKASKPKTGVFCVAINEARETTALEMPDKEATFVLRVKHLHHNHHYCIITITMIIVIVLMII